MAERALPQKTGPVVWGSGLGSTDLDLVFRHAFALSGLPARKRGPGILGQHFHPGPGLWVSDSENKQHLGGRFDPHRSRLVPVYRHPGHSLGEVKKVNSSSKLKPTHTHVSTWSYASLVGRYEGK